MRDESSVRTIAPGKRTIVVLAFDAVTLSDIAGPVDVFHMSEELLAVIDPHRGLARYELIVASPNGGPVRPSSGVPISTIALRELDGMAIDTLMVPGGGPPNDPPVPGDVTRWLRENGARARRICSVCTGIFLVAEAGLADGRRVTTHWMAANSLSQRYPGIVVDSDPIFVRDGDLWSSAGFTAGLDLALALVEEDYGHNVAIQLARNLVMFLKRPGGQSQFSAPLASQSAGDAAFDKLHAWIMDNLAAKLPIPLLAERAGMAPRTFARRYTMQIGRTPAKTIEMFRLEAACRQLCGGVISLKKVAADNGFGDEQNLRRAFVRNFGVIPQQYRERFGSYVER
jgi:transcriptional regulator GlxA family with amidase domain